MKRDERSSPVEQKGESAMTTDYRNELADNELENIVGGGYVHLHPTGFGVKTDFILSQKQVMESNFRGVLTVPTLP